MCTSFALAGYPSDLFPFPDHGYNQYLLHWMKMTRTLPLALFQLQPTDHDPSR